MCRGLRRKGHRDYDSDFNTDEGLLGKLIITDLMALDLLPDLFAPWFVCLCFFRFWFLLLVVCDCDRLSLPAHWLTFLCTLWINFDF